MSEHCEHAWVGDSEGRTTVAVPCSEVDALGVEAALSYDYSGPVVPNKSEIWEKLFGKRVEVKPNV